MWYDDHGSGDPLAESDQDRKRFSILAISENLETGLELRRSNGIGRRFAANGLHSPGSATA
jgi:hypothetical protein